MNVKLLTEHHLELLSLTGGCTGSSESTLVKMPHCWKSRVVAHYYENKQCESASREDSDQLRLYLSVIKGFVAQLGSLVTY